ncbi:V-type ATP synthase subunit F [Lagierella sp.]|uniref:V-type ATP synthase subunit F n=1 Tax=Lagierella sp. TaxID=2849657 RepID=UPI00262E5F89|nr:V-type ATP synthase subunit F [Lagierella sp.]
MHRVAVVGDRDSVLGFRALGVKVFTALEAMETRQIVDKLAKENYGIIFITEQLAKLIPETIERYNNEITPAVILIPSNQGSLNIGLDRINKNVEKAVGSNIL